MREGILRINAEHRSLLSNDLGAVTGLLFDVGAGRRAGRRSFAHRGARLALRSRPSEVTSLPGAESVRLIDVLRLGRGSAKVEAALEVEHTTSIYSGIVRMLDLARGVPGEPKAITAVARTLA